MNFKVCVVGCGDLGSFHARTWAGRDDSEVVAVVDLNKDSAEKLAEELECRAYSDFKEGIMHDGVNAVSVCTPTAFHPDVSCFAMENGRDVLCEKPIALTLEEAERMIMCSEKTGRKLGISFQKRGFPSIIKCRELFAKGVFGKTLNLVVASAAPVRPKRAMHSKKLNGGPVIDLLCHHMDTVCFITGEKPVSVFAAGSIFAEDKNWIPDPENLAVDTAAVTVKYSGGSILSYYINWGLPANLKPTPEARNEVYYGANAYAFAEGKDLSVVHGDRKETFYLPEAKFTPDVRISDLVNAVREGGELEVGGPEGLTALKVSLAALESIESGKAVDI